MMTLQEKLATALQSYQSGHCTREQLLEATRAEYELNRQSWELAPHGTLGDALAAGLEHYASALEQLEELLESEHPLDDQSLMGVWQSLNEAEQLLQELEDECEQPDEGDSL